MTKGAKAAKRNTYMIQEHHVVVFPVNYASTFCMRLCVSNGSDVKYTYMIDREHNHVVLPDYTNLSQAANLLIRKTIISPLRH